ncbi:diacylglycerol/lipid kinase family protein [Marinobacter sp. F4206]|uniref:diacylglycerol/lipid kinase family protein n=1 Tax=Marinobacter sp. F4206 TaxID=2861777 RepID=UPI001C5D15B8|nr:YegS/Rv2252/BmrU family lipid kinase [Marinobacter sp. F4206]MBW4934034.1 YegS/Rv2252/BmrU family lipid kinase [Marinobacter sp. F4206]
MTHWLVANPNAGSGDRGREFWLDVLASAGVADPECCDFADDDWIGRVRAGDVVMVAGGDGSVNRGAQVCVEKHATLAVLPSGTANDFARNLGLPEEPADLCALIASGTRQWVDIAEFGHSLFLNVAHIGLGTLPVRESEGAEKKMFGRFSYGIGLLRRINAKRGFKAEIRCDKGFVKGRWLSIAVASGAFFGGGNEIPEASANDGQLDVIAVKPRPLFQLLLTFLMVRLNRSSPQRTSTIVHLKGTHCSVQTGKPKTVTADGDVVGETPLKVLCRPHVLSVIGPTVVSTGSSSSAAGGQR